MAAVERVGASGWYILGNEVSAFEDELGQFIGNGHVVGCASGLDAIEIALRVEGIGPGDKVLTTPLSAFATSLAIIRAGAEPVFCDVDNHGLLDVTAAEQALTEHPDIRCIVPVHLFGHLADMPALARLGEQHGAIIIEDAAQAIGARRDGHPVGEYGRMATYSFYPTKNLGVIGDGGALATADPVSAERAAAIRNYGQSGHYVHDLMGMNSRLDELHAATLNTALLPRLSGWLETRRKNAARYLAEIDNSAVTLMPGPDQGQSGWHLFPILVEASRREDFLTHLGNCEVAGGLHYPTLIPDQKAITDRGEPITLGDLANARRFAHGEVSLPIHPYLTDEELTHVISAVNQWGG